MLRNRHRSRYNEYVCRAYVEVGNIILHHCRIDLIEFGAVCSAGDSEDIIHIVFLLGSDLSILVIGVSCLLCERVGSQLIVRDELLCVTVLLVNGVRSIHELDEHHDLAGRTHTFYRTTQALACLRQLRIAVEIDVCQTLLTQDISRRVLGIIAEILDTFVLHLDGEFRQTLFLSGIGCSLIEGLYDLRTVRVDGLIGIRAVRVNVEPRLIRIGEHLVLHGLVEEGYVHHALFSDDRFCIRFGSYYRRLSRHFGRFLSHRQRRNGCCQGYYKKIFQFHNDNYFS